MDTKYNFSQLKSSSEVTIIRHHKVTYRTIPLTQTFNMVVGTDSGMSKKTYYATSINCNEKLCNNKARDFLTVGQAINAQGSISYSPIDVKKGAIRFQLASNSLLTSANIIVRVSTNADTVNYNEYAVLTAGRLEIDTPYSYIVKLSDLDGNLITPTATAGTGMGSTGTTTFNILVNDTVIATQYTVSLLEVSFIPDVTDLNKDIALDYGCIDSVQNSNTFSVIARRCFAPQWSNEAKVDELTLSVRALPESFRLLNPEAIITENQQIGQIETTKAPLTAKTINGVNYASYQLPTDFAPTCNFDSVELPNCGSFKKQIKLAHDNAFQDLLSDEYIVYREVVSGNDQYYILVDDQFVGQEAFVKYTKVTTGSIVSFSPDNKDNVYYEFIGQVQMQGTDGKEIESEIRINNVLPTSVPNINLSGTDEVVNEITLSYNSKDMTITTVTA